MFVVIIEPRQICFSKIMSEKLNTTVIFFKFVMILGERFVLSLGNPNSVIEVYF